MNSETTYAIYKLMHKSGNTVDVVIVRNNWKLY